MCTRAMGGRPLAALRSVYDRRGRLESEHHRRAYIPVGWLLFALLATALPSRAHPLAPALLALDEDASGRVAVRWKTSKLQPRGVELHPILPAGCPATTQPAISEDSNSVSLHWEIDCGDAGLVGRHIGVGGRGGNKIDTLARVHLGDGRVVNTILRAGTPSLRIPARQTRLEVFRTYSQLGAEHILSGPDHLAFVMGLLLLIRRRRQLVETLSAFTFGHSVTVSLAALGAARLPPPLTDLAIAASVLVLALEAARPPAEQAASRLRRRPWLMAVLFGLLHGMGFAGALAQVGLPDVEIPLALCSFNLGIEIGQLAVVCVVLAPLRTVLCMPSKRLAWLAYAPTYAIGSLAALWCWERGLALF